jgi:hypothetical protein
MLLGAAPNFHRIMVPSIIRRFLSILISTPGETLNHVCMAAIRCAVISHQSPLKFTYNDAVLPYLRFIIPATAYGFARLSSYAINLGAELATSPQGVAEASFCSSIIPLIMDHMSSKDNFEAVEVLVGSDGIAKDILAAELANLLARMSTRDPSEREIIKLHLISQASPHGPKLLAEPNALRILLTLSTFPNLRHLSMSTLANIGQWFPKALYESGAISYLSIPQYGCQQTVHKLRMIKAIATVSSEACESLIDRGVYWIFTPTCVALD